ncbi:peptide-methionine (S)-S-oxide reductase [Sphingomonas paeninsulae]|uniref:Peptide methionine sulfoxide reductase MsrA n=1 Tax=Sphingomonas paeninsulae TaxID=2319844 RepID=A0A494TB23_SPHPE|nr:peptide-methionine (S)-S-oxide reductase MsrA [Sphingomonas paeninsulae]AYJ86577.1 peptide-methionine (S)-S-oxide reductase [Sphingomonas paeninsulae]
MKNYVLPISVALLLAGGVAIQFAGAAERTVLAPIPVVDAPASGHTATAIFAGGCFWGMEAVFSHVRGVTSVVSGYAGGMRSTANYETVSTEMTRHAEAIKITYDPARVSYGTLLRVLFSVAMNPTELNRQGPDSGTSYRSAIFPQSPDQGRVARAYIGQLTASKVWGAPIVTKLETGGFFPAEAYHQNFAALNPNNGYIRTWDAPKLVALQKTFPALWSARPVG